MYVNIHVYTSKGEETMYEYEIVEIKPGIITFIKTKK